MDPAADVLSPQRREDLLLDELRLPLLDHQHRALPGTEVADLFRHQRTHDVERQYRDQRVAKSVGETVLLQRTDERVVEPAQHDDAEVVAAAGERLVQTVLGDEAPRRRHPFAVLHLFLPERRRRMRQPVIVEHRRRIEQVPAGNEGRDVVLAGEAAAHVAGANAQLKHRRRGGRLGQRERLLDHPHHVRELGPRVEQQQRRLERERERALLDHAGTLAVILADDDQRAAGHTGRSEIGQRVGGDIGADDRLPRHRTAERIVDRCAQHRRRRGLVGAGFDLHAELGQVVLRLDQHVEQVRHRRALVAADIRDARLQQGLGDREDAFAVEGLPRAAAQHPGFPAEGNFHQPLRAA